MTPQNHLIFALLFGSSFRQTSNWQLTREYFWHGGKYFTLKSSQSMNKFMFAAIHQIRKERMRPEYRQARDIFVVTWRPRIRTATGSDCRNNHKLMVHMVLSSHPFFTGIPAPNSCSISGTRDQVIYHCQLSVDFPSEPPS